MFKKTVCSPELFQTEKPQFLYLWNSLNAPQKARILENYYEHTAVQGQALRKQEIGLGDGHAISCGDATLSYGLIYDSYETIDVAYPAIIYSEQALNLIIEILEEDPDPLAIQNYIHSILQQDIESGKPTKMAL